MPAIIEITNNHGTQSFTQDSMYFNYVTKGSIAAGTAGWTAKPSIAYIDYQSRQLVISGASITDRPMLAIHCPAGGVIARRIAGASLTYSISASDAAIANGMEWFLYSTAPPVAPVVGIEQFHATTLARIFSSATRVARILPPSAIAGRKLAYVMSKYRRSYVERRRVFSELGEGRAIFETTTESIYGAVQAGTGSTGTVDIRSTNIQYTNNIYVPGSEYTHSVSSTSASGIILDVTGV